MPGNFDIPLCPVHLVRVLLDGLDVTDGVVSWTTQASQEQRHDEATLTVTPDLGARCDPAVSAGSPRLVIEIDGQGHHFLVEKRGLGERTVTVWGRSASARLDAPHATILDYNGNGQARSAREVAQEWAAPLALDWQALGDWQLPPDFTWSSTPGEGLAMLAQACGCVVRATPSGGLVVRPKWTCSPREQQGRPPALIYDRLDNLLSCSGELVPATGYTAVEVEGHAADIQTPELVQEEGDVQRGGDVYLRAYWRHDPRQLECELYTSHGEATFLGDYAEEIEEVVAFEAGAAAVGKPVLALVGWEWLGLDQGPVELVAPWAGDLRATSGRGYGVAKVRYQTAYRRIRLYGHDAEAVQAVLLLSGAGDVRVEATLAGHVEVLADEVLQEPAQTSPALAVERARQWLYEQAYPRQSIRWTAPWQAHARDGVQALVWNPEGDVAATAQIVSCTTTHDGLRLTQEMEGAAWRV